MRAVSPLSELAGESTHPPRSILLVISMKTWQPCKHEHIPVLLYFSTQGLPTSFQLGERFKLKSQEHKTLIYPIQPSSLLSEF